MREGEIETLLVALTWCSALGSALIAGVFFAFSAFVMGALSRLAPSQGIAAMQSINTVVVRSWFMAPFMGTIVTAAILALAGVLVSGDPRTIWWIAGAALYIAGTFGMTLVGNVPLNEALASAPPEAPESANLWNRYLRDWSRWNHARTAAALGAAVCFVIALR